MDGLDIRRAALCAGLVLGLAVAAGAQTLPRIGVTGSWGTKQGMDKQYAAVKALIVGTAEGVRRMGDALTGGPAAGSEELQGLLEGTTVLVRYSGDGTSQAGQEAELADELGQGMTEGMITRIDRGRGQITVRLDHGRTETLQLSNRAGQPGDSERRDAGSPVVVYFPNENGLRVAHYFTVVR